VAALRVKRLTEVGEEEQATVLRACLVKVRVRMFLYALSYEKAVSD
jgi:hypothetical protein